MAASRFSILARSFSTSVVTQQLVKPPVQVFGLEGRYATALYSAASKQKALNAVDKDIKEISGLLKTDPQLKEFLLNPLLSKELKKEAIDSVLAKKNADALTVNLFGMWNLICTRLLNVKESFWLYISISPNGKGLNKELESYDQHEWLTLEMLEEYEQRMHR